MRRKAAETATTASGEPAAPVSARSRASPTWAMLIKRVFEFDPLVCAKCGGTILSPDRPASSLRDSP